MSGLLDHTAAGQALGYFFQLDRALCQIASAPQGALIGVETEDDIVVKLKTGEKIHEQDKSSTTVFPFIPSKPDLWKSLCIWAEGVKTEEINPELTHFLLVTNKSLTECPAKKISDATTEKEIDACFAELKTFQAKANENTKKYLDKLFSYDDTILKTIIERTSLITGELIVGDSLKNELISALQIVDGDDEEKLSIINQVYGWLFNQVKTAWQNSEPAWIERDALIRLKNNIISKQKEAFFNEKIFEQRDISEEEKAIHKLKVYVKQLKIIDSTDGEVIEAISDYLNSVEKRTRLAKKGYVTDLQIQKMCKDLKTRWATISKRTKLIHKSLPAEEIGKLICLETLEHNATVGGVTTQSYFFTRGTYHHLADSLDVGWHPEYEKTIKTGD